ncbi:uncharacterized protein DUF560 [Nicoletella semolina]|uniref:Uncharacterized protein DUF560 n=1 Tax=Nicoletella semolina TaxID=271160 RepID=A0A4R2NCN5_9PAST|nr:porin family protein [Nicoletella semolina]MDH2924143.1 hypothetical protein [Nicoletella semolina]TCP18961.1 uncharacterized protein DUF560 [Nicoletella semolina]
MKNKHILFLSTVLVTGASLANAQQQSSQQQLSERLNDLRVQSEIQSHHTKPNLPEKTEQISNHQRDSSISMSKAELRNYPDLVMRALVPAILQGNIENVELLYPIYQQIPEQYHDPIITHWSEAILAKQKQDYPKSIRLYRQIIAENKEILPARLQLAITLFEDNQLEAAEDQLTKLRTEPLATEIHILIERYLAAINQRDRWNFNGGVTYLRDPNINNAPKNNIIRTNNNQGRLTGSTPESAEGVGFNADIGKKWSWGNGFFNELRLNSNGKYLWDNKKYNEANLRGSIGLGFQNAKYNIAALPFVAQYLYAGGSNQSETLKRFSTTYGVTTEMNYWLQPKWRWNINYEYGEQRYRSRLHLNGNYHFISTGLLYFANAKQYWALNLNYNRTSTRDKDDSFFRRGAGLGWGQEWGYGFSTHLSFNIAQKVHKAPTLILGLQRNKEYSVQVSTWNRAIHFGGITPRLTYSYNKVKSNHQFTTYDKHRVFVEFSKQF